MKSTIQALRLLAGLTLLTGVLYPLAVWAAGRLCFRHAAEGSLLTRNGVLIGSALLAQKNEDPRYFSPRPSAGDFATVASGASNLAWTSAKLRETSAASARLFRGQNHLPGTTALPADAVTASGSGLDPGISPAYADLQAARVAKARGMSIADVRALIDKYTTGRALGFLGEPTVNVMQLNLDLDRRQAG